MFSIQFWASIFLLILLLLKKTCKNKICILLEFLHLILRGNNIICLWCLKICSILSSSYHSCLCMLMCPWRETVKSQECCFSTIVTPGLILTMHSPWGKFSFNFNNIWVLLILLHCIFSLSFHLGFLFLRKVVLKLENKLK